MKKTILIVMSLFATLTLVAQQPRGMRPLPNQFRDFLDHQQGLERQRPHIEKKDGKVIITMSTPLNEGFFIDYYRFYS